MLERPCRVTLLEQRPAPVGMGRGILRVLGQRRVDRRAGFSPAPQLDQRHRAEVRAPGVLRIESQPLLRRVQRVLPAPLIEMHRAEQRPVTGILGVEPDGFLDGGGGVGVRVSVVRDPGQRAVCEGEGGGEADARWSGSTWA